MRFILNLVLCSILTLTSIGGTLPARASGVAVVDNTPLTGLNCGACTANKTSKPCFQCENDFNVGNVPGIVPFSPRFIVGIASNPDFFSPEVKFDYTMCLNIPLFGCRDIIRDTLTLNPYYAECKSIGGAGGWIAKIFMSAVGAALGVVADGVALGLTAGMGTLTGSLLGASLLRHCVRYTPPGQYGNNSDRAKFCVFQDPWDITDMPPGDNMPYHHVEAASTGAMQAGNIIGTGTAYAGLYQILTGGIVTGIATIVAGHFLGEAVGKIPTNLIVLQNMGCVDMPPAPAPPPFCNSLTGSRAPLKVERICSEGEISTATSPCVNTTPSHNSYQASYNSFANNLVRISFRKGSIPLCMNLPQNGANRECANLYGTNLIGTTLTATIHEQHNDLLNVCDASRSNIPCVTVPANYRVGNKVPVRYKTAKFVNNNIAFDGFDLPWIALPPPIVGETDYKLLVWGIEPTQFIDAGCKFAEAGSTTCAPQIKQGATLEDDDQGQSAQVNIYAKGTNANTGSANTVSDLTQICVKPTNNAQDEICVPRPAIPKPIVAKCGEKKCVPTGSNNCIGPVACSSTLVSPAIAIGLLGQADWIGPSNSNKPYAFIHGRKFTAIATDNNYVTPYIKRNADGSFAHEPLPSNTTLSYDSNGNYQSGATKMCINGGYQSAQYVLAKTRKIPPSGVSSQTLASDPDYTIASDYISDRIDPAVVSGQLELTDEQYYTLGGTLQNGQAVRIKNPLENGMCVDVPMGCFPTDFKGQALSFNLGNAVSSYPYVVNEMGGTIQTLYMRGTPYISPGPNSISQYDTFAYKNGHYYDVSWPNPSFTQGLAIVSVVKQPSMLYYSNVQRILFPSEHTTIGSIVEFDRDYNKNTGFSLRIKNNSTASFMINNSAPVDLELPFDPNGRPLIVVAYVYPNGGMQVVVHKIDSPAGSPAAISPIFTPSPSILPIRSLGLNLLRVGASIEPNTNLQNYWRSIGRATDVVPPIYYFDGYLGELAVFNSSDMLLQLNIQTAIECLKKKWY
jgi:hypothetical protein